MKKIHIFAVLAVVVLVAAFAYAFWFNPNPNMFLQSSAARKIQESFNRGDIDGSIRLAEEATAKNSNDSMAYTLLSLSYSQKGTLEFKEQEYGAKAVEAANKAISFSPKNSEAYRALGYAYEIQQKYNDAFSAYNQAIVLDSSNYQAIAARAHAYDLFGDIGNAKIGYEQALKLEPSLDLTRLNLARVYVREQTYDKATAELKRLTQSAKNVTTKADAYQVLGTISLIQSQSAQAVSLFEQSVQLFASSSSAQAGLAQAHLLYLAQTLSTSSSMEVFLKHIEQVFDHAQLSLDINPAQATGYLALADATLLIGEKAEAKKIYQFMLDTAVDNDITLGAQEKVGMKAYVKDQLSKIK
ncbi:MAG: hypothetical protein RL094_253 [Candidatus Parcubacteria bacterium]|jgi:tetratricopeptide (TPR) repeat protein